MSKVQRRGAECRENSLRGSLAVIVTKTATGRGKARREGGKSGEGQTRMALPTRSGFGVL